MSMKRLLKYFVIVIISISIISCEDLLNTHSPQLTLEDDYGLKNANDSIYSLFGLLTQLQKLGDGYVLLGELRGDLMTTTNLSDKYLREIENFELSEDNPYLKVKDYYAVINNCNYILAKLDTNAVDAGQRLKIREFATVKAIRAWTYMQLSLNFGKAYYYTTPILTIADSQQDFPELNFDELADLLINDLRPVSEIDNTVLGNIDEYNTLYSFMPVKLVLGDLYLWKGRYAEAALMYHDLMYDRSIVVNSDNKSTWESVNNTISSKANLYWQRSLTLASNEVVSAIACPTEYGQTFWLDTLNNHRWIAPTAQAVRLWDQQIYFLNEASTADGDLRKYGSISYTEETNTELTTDYTFTGMTISNPLIYKYKLYEQNINICRASTLYLRYAEAVNRLNKPNLAFAVLKHGINSTNFLKNEIVPAKEKSVPVDDYMNFYDARFTNNTGIRSRGLGNVNNDNTMFIIPQQADLLDSVRYVENLILEEIALETAFEGNRFQDLMRFTLRRMNDQKGDTEAYLADKVGVKNAALKTLLMDKNNWYIKR